jgi:hypothetical protein
LAHRQWSGIISSIKVLSATPNYIPEIAYP